MQDNPDLKKIKPGEENGIKRIDFTKTYTPQTLFSLLPLANTPSFYHITFYVQSIFIYFKNVAYTYINSSLKWLKWNTVQFSIHGNTFHILAFHLATWFSKINSSH